jgi:adenylate cyclase
MTCLEVAPLHRLLERRETAVLLNEFAALMSGVELALFGADGRPFVGRVEWLPEELAEGLEQARMGRMVYEGDRLFVPLMAGEQVVGVLAVHGPDLTHPSVDHVLHCLRRSLGMLVTQALEKRSIARETLERYREINLLYNIGETIGTCLDPEEIPRLVLVEANRVIRADVGVVLLPTMEGEGELDVKDSFGASGYAEALHEDSRHVIGRVRATGQPAIVTDLLADPVPIRAILCAPLKTQERVLGVILLGRLEGEPVFTAGEEKLLMALAMQAAIAVENAHLFADVKRQRDSIAAMKNYMDDIFASIASGVVTTDVQDIVTTLNRAAECILEVRAEEAVGQSCVEALPELGRVLVPLIKTVRRKDEQITGYELVRGLPSRGQVVLRLHISPLKDSHQITTGVALVLDDLTEQRQLEQKVRQVRETFERYVAPRVVEKLLSDPSSVRLGGVRGEVTTLFADIRDFTPFSERVEPEVLVEVLNRYLTLAAEAVLAEEGTLDKFMGDAVMAVFNAPLFQPNHALRAVRAALAMQQAVAEMHAHLLPTERLSFGVGITTGPAVVGNIGSTIIHNYTAIGDSINLASRLQGHAHPGQILLNAVAYERVCEHVIGRELGHIQVKGHREPVLAFEVFGLRK